MGLLRCVYVLISISFYYFQPILGVAQETFEPREFLSERLFNALEWRTEPHYVKDGAPAWQLCRTCTADAPDSIEAHIAYLQFLKEVNTSVREFVGFSEVPAAPDNNPEVRDPSDSLRGAVIVRPVQDSAVTGFWLYRLRIEEEGWFIDTAGVSTYPEFNNKGDIVKAECNMTRELSGREQNLILGTSRPIPSIEPLTGNRHRGAFCIDGSPTISEIAFVSNPRTKTPLTSRVFVRECAAADSITQFSKVIASLGGIETPLRHCVRSISN